MCVLCVLFDLGTCQSVFSTSVMRPKLWLTVYVRNAVSSVGRAFFSGRTMSFSRVVFSPISILPRGIVADNFVVVSVMVFVAVSMMSINFLKAGQHATFLRLILPHTTRSG